MSTIEKIRAKRELCEIVGDIIDREIRWRKKSAITETYKDEETGEWLDRPKMEEEITEHDRAVLAAIEQIEQALVKLI